MWGWGRLERIPITSGREGVQTTDGREVISKKGNSCSPQEQIWPPQKPVESGEAAGFASFAPPWPHCRSPRLPCRSACREEVRATDSTSTTVLYVYEDCTLVYLQSSRGTKAEPSSSSSSSSSFCFWLTNQLVGLPLLWWGGELGSALLGPSRNAGWPRKPRTGRRPIVG